MCKTGEIASRFKMSPGHRDTTLKKTGRSRFKPRTYGHPKCTRVSVNGGFSLNGEKTHDPRRVGDAQNGLTDGDGDGYYDIITIGICFTGARATLN